MPAQKVRQFLDQSGIKYVTVTHSPAYTAQEIAASAHIPGQELAKIVMVKIDGKMAMVVLPASRKLDLTHLRELVGAKKVELASEAEFQNFFPETELGAMPPFGNLYGLGVYADRALSQQPQIAFNAGSHTELIRMRFEDYRNLASPQILDLSRSYPEA